MKRYFLFAGSFCPPTYGHVAVLKQAAEMFPFVTVVCSRDDAKGYWFSPQECVKMWQAYDLPQNVEVITYDEQVKRAVKGEQITLIRGIRDSSDYITEQKVIDLNSKEHNIKSYVYILATDNMVCVSASAARKAAQDVNLAVLASCVAPAIVTRLLETARMFKSLHMVVGQPGGGKTTFGKILAEGRDDIAWINTDGISLALRSIAQKHFGEDLVKVSIEKSQELSDLIGEAWLDLLAERLRQVPPRQHVFVEVAYGLVDDKRTQRFLGNKVVYIGCDEATQRSRIIDRGTPQHEPFFSIIPNLAKTKEIAKCEGLSLLEVNTSGSTDRLAKEAQRLLTEIEGS